ncbi:V-ATPase V1 sector subunit E [Komagataella kurtzmanii]|nr:V-ATPase V1 sector subunit E [Komagataella kurtzmanii]
MSSNRALSDEQVENELKKMEVFIKKEAEEKAKEIRLKADEEYEIEKALIVRSEANAIDSLYDDRFKKASLAQQIKKSTIANKSRLKVLGEKEKILDDILETTQARLKDISKDSAAYEEVLVGLIEEGVLALFEKVVTVRVRKQDLKVAKKAAEKAAIQFEEKAKFPVQVAVSESEFLSDDLAGGVVLVNEDGRIEVDNTLEERLKLLSSGALPAVRLELFGISKTRKFFE